MTLRELVDRLRRERGIEIRSTASPEGTVLRRGNRFHTLLHVDENEILPLRVLETLCEVLDLPYLDLGLDPQPDDD